MGHTVDVNENVYTRTSLKRRRDAVNALESALGLALTDENGLAGNRGCWQVIEKDGAGDGTRTRDVQLPKLDVAGSSPVSRSIFQSLRNSH